MMSLYDYFTAGIRFQAKKEGSFVPDVFMPTEQEMYEFLANAGIAKVQQFLESLEEGEQPK